MICSNPWYATKNMLPSAAGWAFTLLAMDHPKDHPLWSTGLPGDIFGYVQFFCSTYRYRYRYMLFVMHEDRMWWGLRIWVLHHWAEIHIWFIIIYRQICLELDWQHGSSRMPIFKKKTVKFQATMFLEIWGWIQIAPFCSHHQPGGHTFFGEKTPPFLFLIWSLQSWGVQATWNAYVHIETERENHECTHWSNIQHIQRCSIIVVLLKTHIHISTIYYIHILVCIWDVSQKYRSCPKHINTQMSKSGFQQ